MADYKNRKRPRQAITDEAFNNGNALSFEGQPALRELFDILTDDAVDLTIIVGAGVSVDAGFPGWGRLVARLTDHVADETLRRLALLDAEDGSMRHAESIFRMLQPGEPDSDAGVLREALYRHMPTTEPGPIAMAIAKLWRSRKGRVSIVTTNFDDVLEEAFESILQVLPESFSLYAAGADEDPKPEGAREWAGINEWATFVRDHPERPAVMHLHGMVRRRLDPLRPVVLSESHFLWHGPKVRDVVRDCLRTSAVLFVGVSLNDPDLVGPLWDLRRSEPDVARLPCFVLHVPNEVVGAISAAEARSYVLAKYDYMEDALGVLPIFLKSYSQLLQVFNEMRLHLEEPGYFEASAEPPLVYGKRYERMLKSAHERVTGLGQDPSARFELQSSISLALHEILEPRAAVGQILQLRKPQHRRDLVNLRREFDQPEYWAENFGLFLWLRTLASSGEAAPYTLELSASSTYIHRDAWSFRRTVGIDPQSPYPVAESVFSGLILFRNLPKAGDFTLWRGTFVMPLRLAGHSLNGVPADVTIGAIALNTTHYVYPDHDRCSGSVSSLAVLKRSRSATDELREALSAEVTAALTVSGDLALTTEPVSPESF